MKLTTKVAVTLAVSALSVGIAASSATAVTPFDITSIPASPASTPFTGTGLNAQTFKIGSSGPTWTCSSATFAGATHNVLGDPASVLVQPTFGGTGTGGSCPAGILGNSDVTVTNPWRVEVIGGSGATHSVKFDLTGSTWKIRPRTVPGCEIIIDGTGNTNLVGLTAHVYTAGGVSGTDLRGAMGGITFRVGPASSCPGIGPANFTSNTMVYTASTGSALGIRLPNVTITP